MRPARCWRKWGVRARDHEGELTAAPRLLAAIPLAGRTITGDALYCQRALCAAIGAAQGHYLFFVKGNQGQLSADIQLLFTDPPPGERFATAIQRDYGHGRREVRRVWVSTALTGYLDWPGAAQVGKVERQWIEDGDRHTDTRYFVTSRGASTTPATLLQLTRGHWGIENRAHYVRDVTMGEDRSRVRTGAAPEILAALRNVVLALLRAAQHACIATALRDLAWSPAAQALACLGLAISDN
jgi:predicted transposase YbfD/YdcC